MNRRPLTTLQRAKLFLDHGGMCHICSYKIVVPNEAWQVEHVVPFAMGGKDDVTNMRPAHVDCHAAKTKNDVKAIAKVKRIQAKHIGSKAPSKWPSRKMNPPKFDNTKHVNGDYDT
jgi:5-methylcytosine-specific restriction enzyme A